MEIEKEYRKEKDPVQLKPTILSPLTLEAPILQNAQIYSNSSPATAANYLSVFDHFVGLALKGLRAV